MPEEFATIDLFSDIEADERERDWRAPSWP